MNNTSSAEPATIFAIAASLQYIAAAVYAAIGLPGVAAYAAVFWSIDISRDEFKTPFYWLIYSIGAADLGILLVYNICYIVPCLMFRQQIGPPWIGRSVAFIEAVCFVSHLGTITVMSISRLIAIVFPLMNKPSLTHKLMNNRNVAAWVLAAWLHGVGIVSGILYAGCDLVVSGNLLGIMYICDAYGEQVNSTIATYITGLIFGVGFMNFGTLALLMKKKSTVPSQGNRNQNDSSQPFWSTIEARYFIQSAMVWASLFTENACWMMVSIFNMWSLPNLVLLGCTVLLNSAINPFIFMWFNAAIRRKLFPSAEEKYPGFTRTRSTVDPISKVAKTNATRF